MTDSDDEFYNYLEEVLENRRLPKRYLRDLVNPLEFYGEDDFRRRFRFRKDSFVNVVLPLVEEELSQPTNRGLPISPVHQLLLALRFYATGSYQVCIILCYSFYG